MPKILKLFVLSSNIYELQYYFFIKKNCTRFCLLTEAVASDSASWQSTTTPTKPMTHDKIYYFLPYWDNKPCMHIRSVWSDYRRRMYNSNIIAKIAEKLVSAPDNI